MQLVNHRPSFVLEGLVVAGTAIGLSVVLFAPTAKWHRCRGDPPAHPHGETVWRRVHNPELGSQLRLADHSVNAVERVAKA